MSNHFSQVTQPSVRNKIDFLIQTYLYIGRLETSRWCSPHQASKELPTQQDPLRIHNVSIELGFRDHTQLLRALCWYFSEARTGSQTSAPLTPAQILVCEILRFLMIDNINECGEFVWAFWRRRLCKTEFCPTSFAAIVLLLSTSESFLLYAMTKTDAAEFFRSSLASVQQALAEYRRDLQGILLLSCFTKSTFDCFGEKVRSMIVKGPAAKDSSQYEKNAENSKKWRHRVDTDGSDTIHDFREEEHQGGKPDDHKKISLFYVSSKVSEPMTVVKSIVSNVSRITGIGSSSQSGNPSNIMLKGNPGVEHRKDSTKILHEIGKNPSSPQTKAITIPSNVATPTGLTTPEIAASSENIIRPGNMTNTSGNIIVSRERAAATDEVSGREYSEGGEKFEFPPERAILVDQEMCASDLELPELNSIAHHLGEAMMLEMAPAYVSLKRAAVVEKAIEKAMTGQSAAMDVFESSTLVEVPREGLVTEQHENEFEEKVESPQPMDKHYEKGKSDQSDTNDELIVEQKSSPSVSKAHTLCVRETPLPKPLDSRMLSISIPLGFSVYTCGGSRWARRQDVARQSQDFEKGMTNRKDEGEAWEKRGPEESIPQPGFVHSVSKTIAKCTQRPQPDQTLENVADNSISRNMSWEFSSPPPSVPLSELGESNKKAETTHFPPDFCERKDEVGVSHFNEGTNCGTRLTRDSQSVLNLLQTRELLFLAFDCMYTYIAANSNFTSREYVRFVQQCRPKDEELKSSSKLVGSFANIRNTGAPRGELERKRQSFSFFGRKSGNEKTEEKRGIEGFPANIPSGAVSVCESLWDGGILTILEHQLRSYSFELSKEVTESDYVLKHHHMRSESLIGDNRKTGPAPSWLRVIKSILQIQRSSDRYGTMKWCVNSYNEICTFFKLAVKPVCCSCAASGYNAAFRLGLTKEDDSFLQGAEDKAVCTCISQVTMNIVARLMNSTAQRTFVSLPLFAYSHSSYFPGLVAFPSNIPGIPKEDGRALNASFRMCAAEATTASREFDKTPLLFRWVRELCGVVGNLDHAPRCPCCAYDDLSGDNNFAESCPLLSPKDIRTESALPPGLAETFECCDVNVMSAVLGAAYVCEGLDGAPSGMASGRTAFKGGNMLFSAKGVEKGCNMNGMLALKSHFDEIRTHHNIASLLDCLCLNLVSTKIGEMREDVLFPLCSSIHTVTEYLSRGFVQYSSKLTQSGEPAAGGTQTPGESNQSSIFTPSLHHLLQRRARIEPCEMGNFSEKRRRPIPRAQNLTAQTRGSNNSVKNNHNVNNIPTVSARSQFSDAGDNHNEEKYFERSTLFERQIYSLWILSLIRLWSSLLDAISTLFLLCLGVPRYTEVLITLYISPASRVSPYKSSRGSSNIPGSNTKGVRKAEFWNTESSPVLVNESVMETSSSCREVLYGSTGSSVASTRLGRRSRLEEGSVSRNVSSRKNVEKVRSLNETKGLHELLPLVLDYLLIDDKLEAMLIRTGGVSVKRLTQLRCKCVGFITSLLKCVNQYCGTKYTEDAKLGKHHRSHLMCRNLVRLIKAHASKNGKMNILSITPRYSQCQWVNHTKTPSKSGLITTEMNNRLTEQAQVLLWRDLMQRGKMVPNNISVFNPFASALADAREKSDGSTSPPTTFGYTVALTHFDRLTAVVHKDYGRERKKTPLVSLPLWTNTGAKYRVATLGPVIVRWLDFFFSPTTGLLGKISRLARYRDSLGLAVLRTEVELFKLPPAISHYTADPFVTHYITRHYRELMSLYYHQQWGDAEVSLGCLHLEVLIHISKGETESISKRMQSLKILHFISGEISLERDLEYVHIRRTAQSESEARASIPEQRRFSVNSTYYLNKAPGGSPGGLTSSGCCSTRRKGSTVSVSSVSLPQASRRSISSSIISSDSSSYTETSSEDSSNFSSSGNSDEKPLKEVAPVCGTSLGIESLQALPRGVLESDVYCSSMDESPVAQIPGYQTHPAQSRGDELSKSLDKESGGRQTSNASLRPMRPKCQDRLPSREGVPTRTPSQKTGKPKFVIPRLMLNSLPAPTSYREMNQPHGVEELLPSFPGLQDVLKKVAENPRDKSSAKAIDIVEFVSPVLSKRANPPPSSDKIVTTEHAFPDNNLPIRTDTAVVPIVSPISAPLLSPISAALISHTETSLVTPISAQMAAYPTGPLLVKPTSSPPLSIQPATQMFSIPSPPPIRPSSPRPKQDPIIPLIPTPPSNVPCLLPPTQSVTQHMEETLTDLRPAFENIVTFETASTPANPILPTRNAQKHKSSAGTRAASEPHQKRRPPKIKVPRLQLDALLRVNKTPIEFNTPNNPSKETKRKEEKYNEFLLKSMSSRVEKNLSPLPAPRNVVMYNWPGANMRRTQDYRSVFDRWKRTPSNEKSPSDSGDVKENGKQVGTLPQSMGTNNDADYLRESESLLEKKDVRTLLTTTQEKLGASRNIYYEEGRKHRRLYSDPQLHTFGVVLLLSLLIDEKKGVLSSAYLDDPSSTTCGGKYAHLVETVQHHLNHIYNRALLPLIVHQVDACLGFSGTRLLKFFVSSIFEDKFVLRRKLGCGTHGSVWLVKNKGCAEMPWLAVKKIPALHGSARSLTLFCDVFQEICCLEQSRFSPHCCELMNYGLSGNAASNDWCYCVVLRYYKYTLSEYRSVHFPSFSYILTNLDVARTRLKMLKILCIYGQVLGALAALHKKGVVHYDLKCTNLLVDPNVKMSITPFMGGGKSIKQFKAGSMATSNISEGGSLLYEGDSVFPMKIPPFEQIEESALNSVANKPADPFPTETRKQNDFFKKGSIWKDRELGKGIERGREGGEAKSSFFCEDKSFITKQPYGSRGPPLERTALYTEETDLLSVEGKPLEEELEGVTLYPPFHPEAITQAMKMGNRLRNLDALTMPLVAIADMGEARLSGDLRQELNQTRTRGTEVVKAPELLKMSNSSIANNVGSNASHMSNTITTTSHLISNNMSSISPNNLPNNASNGISSNNLSTSISQNVGNNITNEAASNYFHSSNVNSVIPASGVDVWSGACLLYELLTGQLMYEKDPLFYARVLGGEEVVSPAIQSAFPPLLSKFLMSSMIRDPHKRPSTQEMFEHFSYIYTQLYISLVSETTSLLPPTTDAEEDDESGGDSETVVERTKGDDLGEEEVEKTDDVTKNNIQNDTSQPTCAPPLSVRGSSSDTSSCLPQERGLYGVTDEVSSDEAMLGEKSEKGESGGGGKGMNEMDYCAILSDLYIIKVPSYWGTLVDDDKYSSKQAVEEEFEERSAMHWEFSGKTAVEIDATFSGNNNNIENVSENSAIRRETDGQNIIQNGCVTSNRDSEVNDITASHTNNHGANNTYSTVESEPPRDRRANLSGANVEELSFNFSSTADSASEQVLQSDLARPGVSGGVQAISKMLAVVSKTNKKSDPKSDQELVGISRCRLNSGTLLAEEEGVSEALLSPGNEIVFPKLISSNNDLYDTVHIHRQTPWRISVLSFTELPHSLRKKVSHIVDFRIRGESHPLVDVPTTVKVLQVYGYSEKINITALQQFYAACAKDPAHTDNNLKQNTAGHIKRNDFHSRGSNKSVLLPNTEKGAVWTGKDLCESSIVDLVTNDLLSIFVPKIFDFLRTALVEEGTTVFLTDEKTYFSSSTKSDFYYDRQAVPDISECHEGKKGEGLNTPSSHLASIHGNTFGYKDLATSVSPEPNSVFVKGDNSERTPKLIPDKSGSTNRNLSEAPCTQTEKLPIPESRHETARRTNGVESVPSNSAEGQCSANNCFIQNFKEGEYVGSHSMSLGVVVGLLMDGLQLDCSRVLGLINSTTPFPSIPLALTKVLSARYSLKLKHLWHSEPSSPLPLISHSIISRADCSPPDENYVTKKNIVRLSCLCGGCPWYFPLKLFKNMHFENSSQKKLSPRVRKIRRAKTDGSLLCKNFINARHKLWFVDKATTSKGGVGALPEGGATGGRRNDPSEGRGASGSVDRSQGISNRANLDERESGKKSPLPEDILPSHPDTPEHQQDVSSRIDTQKQAEKDDACLEYSKLETNDLLLPTTIRKAFPLMYSRDISPDPLRTMFRMKGRRKAGDSTHKSEKITTNELGLRKENSKASLTSLGKVSRENPLACHNISHNMSRSHIPAIYKPVMESPKCRKYVEMANPPSSWTKPCLQPQVALVQCKCNICSTEHLMEGASTRHILRSVRTSPGCPTVGQCAEYLSHLSTFYGIDVNKSHLSWVYIAPPVPAYMSFEGHLYQYVPDLSDTDDSYSPQPSQGIPYPSHYASQFEGEPWPSSLRYRLISSIGETPEGASEQKESRWANETQRISAETAQTNECGKKADLNSKFDNDIQVCSDNMMTTLIFSRDMDKSECVSNWQLSYLENMYSYMLPNCTIGGVDQPMCCELESTCGSPYNSIAIGEEVLIEISSHRNNIEDQNGGYTNTSRRTLTSNSKPKSLSSKLSATQAAKNVGHWTKFRCGLCGVLTSAIFKPNTLKDLRNDMKCGTSGSHGLHNVPKEMYLGQTLWPPMLAVLGTYEQTRASPIVFHPSEHCAGEGENGNHYLRSGKEEETNHSGPRAEKTEILRQQNKNKQTNKASELVASIDAKPNLKNMSVNDFLWPRAF